MSFENTTPVAGSLKRVWSNAGSLTDGTAGTFAGMANPGDLCSDTTNGKVYQNTGTKASPIWSKMELSRIRTAKTGGQTLTAAEAGIIPVSTDDVYIYLPTYVSNAGLTYTIKATAAYSAGVHVRGNGAELIDTNNIQTSGAIYDTIEVLAATAGWDVISKIGTWTGTN